jgi:cytochrome c-type biogenesis protein CcmH/NrfG
MNKHINTLSDDELSKRIAELDWEVEPRRDLWPDIHSKIRFAERAQPPTDPSVVASQHLPQRSWAPCAIAASTVLACVSLLFSSMSYQYAQDSKRNQEAMLMYQQAQLSLIEEQHQMVRVQFVQLLEQEGDSLSPDFVNEIQMVMADVDTAAEQIKEAIKSQPNNPDYASMLVSTYQHELKLLNRVKSKQGLSI